MGASSNFNFLAGYDEQVARLGALAECYFNDDAPAALVKLLAEAFRGELVPQDPNDEPAQVLLDRIRAQRATAHRVKRVRKAKETSDA